MVGADGTVGCLRFTWPLTTFTPIYFGKHAELAATGPWDSHHLAGPAWEVHHQFS